MSALERRCRGPLGRVEVATSRSSPCCPRVHAVRTHPAVIVPAEPRDRSRRQPATGTRRAPRQPRQRRQGRRVRGRQGPRGPRQRRGTRARLDRGSFAPGATRRAAGSRASARAACPCYRRLPRSRRRAHGRVSPPAPRPCERGNRDNGHVPPRLRARAFMPIRASAQSLVWQRFRRSVRGFGGVLGRIRGGGPGGCCGEILGIMAAFR